MRGMEGKTALGGWWWSESDGESARARKAGDPRDHLLQPRFLDVGTRVKRLDEGHMAEVPKLSWFMATLGQKKY